MRKRKLRRRFQAEYGAVPDPLYLTGDMEHIRAYYDVRRSMEPDEFHIDDITWNDLDMDRLFQRINPGLTTSGEQYLYYTLRTPSQHEDEHIRRSQLIALMEQNPELRLDLQVILSRLGCSRRADLSTAFRPTAHGRGWLIIYLLLLLMLPVTLILAPLLGRSGLVLPLLSLMLNGIVHEFRRRSCERDYATVNYSVGMIHALRRIQRLRHAALDEIMQPAYARLGRLRAALRIGGLTYTGGDMVTDLMNTALLLDLISYEFLKGKLGCCHEDIYHIHEALGRIDTAIAAASYRQSLPQHTIPTVDYSAESRFIDAAALVHPLLPDAVPNDLHTDQSILLTGSNASGKSTFLKAVMLNAILAQTVCTCTAAHYHASAFRPFTSMALHDDLYAGESYYIVETRSLKRIMDAARQPGQPTLCAVDEVLRGTNTVERIAASCEILRALPAAGALCLAATHDIELCDLLDDVCALYHFEEQISGQAIIFDYQLRPGRATSRNAINLLRLIGFDQTIVEAAHQRANQHDQTGHWSL